MVLHAVAANVRFGGRVWIYGATAEGVGAVVADLPKVRFSSRLYFFLLYFPRTGILLRTQFMRASERSCTQCYINAGSQLPLLTHRAIQP